MNGNASLKRIFGLIFVGAASLGLAACGTVAPAGPDLSASAPEMEVDAGRKAVEPAAEMRSEVSAAEPAQSADASGINAPAPAADDHFKLALVGLRIEPRGKGSNRLVAELESAGFYTFRRTAQSEYVLTLEGAQLSPAVEKAILAPPDSGSIRAVRPVVDGGNVMLRIFAAPEAMLRVQAEGSKLVVGARNELAAGDDAADMMAQAGCDAGGGAEKAVSSPEADKCDEDCSKASTVDSQFTGRLISIDLQDTDIDNALRIISEISNVNIIASPDVTGKVTLQLIDVPWDQALDAILKMKGLGKVQEGNLIRVMPVEKLRAERDGSKEAQAATEELKP